MKPRFLGWREVWDQNGTGSRVLFILWLPVWETTFFHSTAWLD